MSINYKNYNTPKRGTSKASTQTKPQTEASEALEDKEEGALISTLNKRALEALAYLSLFAEAYAPQLKTKIKDQQKILLPKKYKAMQKHKPIPKTAKK